MQCTLSKRQLPLHKLSNDNVMLQASDGRVRTAEHTVHAELGPAGMLPPAHQPGTSPHDWLVVPGENQVADSRHQPSLIDSRQGIHDWLSLQQADRLANGQRLSSEWPGFEHGQALHHATSSTPSLTGPSPHAVCLHSGSRRGQPVHSTLSVSALKTPHLLQQAGLHLKAWKSPAQIVGHWTFKPTGNDLHFGNA